MNNNVFLATPISGFSNENEYQNYRSEVLRLIDFLRKSGYKVCSELESVRGLSDYDSPGKSVEDDFESIKQNDFFILLHPARMQTSSLIEYGFACGQNKKIIAVGRKEDLPYLVVGYADISPESEIIDTRELNDEVFLQIVNTLKRLKNTRSKRY